MCSTCHLCYEKNAIRISLKIYPQQFFGNIKNKSLRHPQKGCLHQCVLFLVSIAFIELAFMIYTWYFGTRLITSACVACVVSSAITSEEVTNSHSRERGYIRFSRHRDISTLLSLTSGGFTNFRKIHRLQEDISLAHKTMVKSSRF